MIFHPIKASPCYQFRFVLSFFFLILFLQEYQEGQLSRRVFTEEFDLFQGRTVSYGESIEADVPETVDRSFRSTTLDPTRGGGGGHDTEGKDKAISA